MKTKIIKLGDGCNLTVTIIDRQGMPLKLATLKSLVISLVSYRSQNLSFIANSDNTLTIPLTYASNLTKTGMYNIRAMGELFDGQAFDYTEQIIEVKDLPESTETTFITSLVLRDVHNITEKDLPGVNYKELGYEVFSPFKTYAKDDIVIFGNKLYKFSDNKLAGIWDASKVETTSVAEAAGDAEIDDSTVSSHKSWSSEKVSGILYGGVNTEELATTVEDTGFGYPARTDGSYERSGYLKNYTVDLTGAYAAGYRKVRFYGFSYNTSSNITQGLVASGKDGDNWIIDDNGISFVPVIAYQAGYCELPITANSTTLVASVLTREGARRLAGQYTEGTDLSYVPTTVQLFDDDSGIVGDINDLDSRVTVLENTSGVNFPDTFLPAKVYGVIGDTLQIFRRSVVVSQEPYAKYLDFTCGQGKVYERYLEITPEKVNGAVPTNLTIKHRLIADNFKKSEQKTSSLILADKPTTSPANNINVLCIGASTTAGGQWPSELKRRLTGTGGTPTADGLTNITFVGRKALGTASTRPVAVNVEATGGWTWKNFYTPKTAIRFTVSGVTSVDVGTVYSYTNANSQLFKVAVQEVNITEGSGEIRCTYASDTVGRWVEGDDTSGTLTRVGSSGGDATIAYSSAVSETYCPFETDEKPGFAEYADMYCNGKIDVLMAYMGNVNEGIRGDSSDEKIEEVINDMKVLLDTLHTDFPNAKVIIGTAALPNAYYGYEYNYSAASANKSWSMTYGLFRYAKAVEEFIAGDDYKDWCFYAGTTTEVDSENAYPVSTKNANTRSERKDVIGTNGAHPTLEGYQMVADSMYRCFVNTILN
jgi:hypothetical protein